MTNQIISQGRHRSKQVGVHQISNFTFNGPPPNDQAVFVDHKDRIKDNNAYDNLRWSTVSENNMNQGHGTREEIVIDGEPSSWATVGEYNGRDLSDCQVSNLGHLKRDGDMLSNRAALSGYVVNGLTCRRTGEYVTCFRHRLVMWAFHKDKYQDSKDE